MGRISPAAFLVALAALVQPYSSDAADWYRYENDYFVAYSDAGERKARKILRELEMFRAAASQVANLRVRKDVPKTEVFVFRKKGRMDDLTGDRQIGGFAINLGGKFVIVTSASGSNEWDAQSIRHEYAHVLLGQLPLPFPQWYSEGFAELVSSLKFVDRETAFTLGEPPINAKYVSGKEIGWNRLVAEGWNYRDQSARIVHGAYIQSWLLTHYAMLGDNFGHSSQLHRYLQAVARGTPSLDAFEQAFGTDPDTLWRRELKEYQRKPFALVFDFQPTDLELDFSREPAAGDPAGRLFDQIERVQSGT